MRFDIAIVGGGLSGLVCGLQLQRQGFKCIIISSGQSSLHFSPGVFDFYSNLPPEVNDTADLTHYLEENSPTHPYSRIGLEGIKRLSAEALDIFVSTNMFSGSGELLRTISPLGMIKRTWMADSDLLTWQGDLLPYRRAAVINIKGFMDFFPGLISSTLNKMGAEIVTGDIGLPELEKLRTNPTEMRSTNIARILDTPGTTSILAKLIQNMSKGCDVVIMPAVVGLNGTDTLRRLEKESGRTIRLIATMPPSVIGIRTEKYLRDRFIGTGGTFLSGDRAVSAAFGNDRVKCLYTEKLGSDAITADEYVLATGNYFSKGLVASQYEVYEPLFRSDVDHNRDRSKWYNKEFLGSQPYQRFGVRTDQNFHVYRNSSPVENLWAAGSILEGCDTLTEGSGPGVSILSAMKIAENIKSKYRS